MESVEVEVNELSRDERRVKWGVIVNQVAQGYFDILSLWPIVAVNYDDEARPNRELSAVHLEYKADVENAVDKAIGNDQVLLKSWISLLESDCETDSPASDVMLQLAIKLGPIFERHGLQPGLYFRRIKKGRPDRSTVGGGSL